MRGALKEITVRITPAARSEVIVMIRMEDPKIREIDTLTRSIGRHLNVELT